MKPEQILSALAKLEPENKDHWTQDGQPLLGAVGGGVKREEILAVAPLFSKTNPVLPNAGPQLTDDEVKKTLEEELLSIEAAKDEANEALAEASRAKVEAEAAIKAAHDRIEKLREDEKTRDPRSDAQINIDYLKSQFEQRLARHASQSHAKQLLEAAGLGSEVKGLTLSPIDRAIAERVMRERRQRK